MRRMTTDFSRTEDRPYFLWDEDLSVRELRAKLSAKDSASERERLRLMAKLLREARDTDVWEFVTLRDVVDAFPRLLPLLGRRRAFWEYLINGWRDDGLLPDSLTGEADPASARRTRCVLHARAGLLSHRRRCPRGLLPGTSRLLKRLRHAALPRP
jgi:hypothetical protein